MSDLFFSWAGETLSDLVQITRYSKTDFYELIRKLDRRKKKAIFEPQLPLERLTKFRSESVTAASKDIVPDCTTCGVCCSYALIVPIRVDETGQLNEYWDVTLDGSQNEIVIERVIPRDIGTGHCSNLAGDLGKEIACRVYPDRPSVCREFDAGSDRCHEYRRMYGLEPRLDKEGVVNEVAKLAKAKPGIITFASIVVDSVSTKVTYSKEDDGRMETTEVTYLKIVALLDDDEEIEFEVHTYNASMEMWFESDLIGMTLPEAKEFIRSRG